MCEARSATHTHTHVCCNEGTGVSGKSGKVSFVVWWVSTLGKAKIDPVSSSWVAVFYSKHKKFMDLVSNAPAYSLAFEGATL